MISALLAQGKTTHELINVTSGRCVNSAIYFISKLVVCFTEYNEIWTFSDIKWFHSFLSSAKSIIVALSSKASNIDQAMQIDLRLII